MDDKPFPYLSNMLECHGFDEVFGGGMLSRMATVSCKKGGGKCCIATCRAVGKTMEPEREFDIFDGVEPAVASGDDRNP